MRESNKKAVEFLLANNYDEIYLKPHRDIRKKNNVEYIHTQNGNYQIMDFYNRFDGFCYNKKGEFVWLQIKTDRWANAVEIGSFFTDKKGIVLILNVRKPTKTHKTYRVDFREMRIQHA